MIISGSLSAQCLMSVGRTRPCIPPAKNARIGRFEILLPPMFLRGFLGFPMVVSGKETSFLATKTPSEVSALQSAFMVLLVSSPCSFKVYGP